MRYYIIAGEASGDLHGSNLIRAIKELDSAAEFRGMGGSKMIKEGMDAWSHYDELAVMGLTDVLRKLFTIKKKLKECIQDLEAFRPERLILIDYGGFNLRIAKKAKALGIAVHFYILPKIWAWNEGRHKKIKKSVDHAYVIFPFEEEYFRKFGINATYVGNPVKEKVDDFLVSNAHLKRSDHIALLPGSRKQEIHKILPAMLETASSMPQHRFILALNADSKKLLSSFALPSNCEVKYDRTYEVVRTAQAAMVTSGTATLETALLGTRQLVCYKTTGLNYFLGKRLINVDFLSPVNLILEREAVPEFIQNECTANHLKTALIELLIKDEGAEQDLSLKELNKRLTQRIASKKCAELILQTN